MDHWTRLVYPFDMLRQTYMQAEQIIVKACQVKGSACPPIFVCPARNNHAGSRLTAKELSFVQASDGALLEKRTETLQQPGRRGTHTRQIFGWLGVPFVGSLPARICSPTLLGLGFASAWPGRPLSPTVVLSVRCRSSASPASGWASSAPTRSSSAPTPTEKTWRGTRAQGCTTGTHAPRPGCARRARRRARISV